jgi:uncharacterized protein (TIGR02265 family)
MLNTVFSPDDPISGTFDVEATARAFTRKHLAKGMFFNRLLSVLGSSFGDLVPSLEAPPRLGKYLPFSDYPQGDYLRLAVAVAERTYPAWSLREGIRRLSRDDFKVFSDSTLGKVLLAVAGDAHAALLNLPSMYMKVATADWKITGEEIDKGAVRITFAPVLGPWEFQLGQLEGLVLAFGKTPSVRVVELPRSAVRFDVRHDE